MGLLEWCLSLPTFAELAGPPKPPGGATTLAAAPTAAALGKGASLGELSESAGFMAASKRISGTVGNANP